MPDQHPYASARFLPDGTVKAWAPCPPEHEAGILRAFEWAFVIKAEFREERFLQAARYAAVPESVIEQVLATLVIEDKSSLRPEHF